MEAVLAERDLSPALRAVLERAAAQEGVVYVIPIDGGGYRLAALGKEAVRDRPPRGRARLGTMQHLGLKLDD